MYVSMNLWKTGDTIKIEYWWDHQYLNNIFNY